MHHRQFYLPLMLPVILKYTSIAITQLVGVVFEGSYMHVKAQEVKHGLNIISVGLVRYMYLCVKKGQLLFWPTRILRRP